MDDKIILFPNRKQQLEKTIQQYIEKEAYQAAIDLLDVLYDYNQITYPYTIYYVVAYRKLNRLTEAEMYGEELVSLKDTYHEEYADLYLMVLYEAEKYQKAIEYIEEEEKSKTSSTVFQTKLQEMKQLLQQMNVWKSEELMKEFQTAVQNEDTEKQYILLQKWRPLKVAIPQTADKYLTNAAIHPVIKTLLLGLLIEEKAERTIPVEKFSSQMSVVPSQLFWINMNPQYKQTMELIEREQQSNPSKAELMKEIHEQYCFVIYPFLYGEQEILPMFQTIASMVDSELTNTSVNQSENKLQQEIEICCRLYQHLMLQ
ncbi:MAG TPA: hypothetical protein VK108_01275 [Pseudogracilibacillus sp.]|nr:hypothetical protein [Pseudogracilibacillus sp.]